MTAKRILLAATGICALALILLAVPALSASPYIPDPVEFEAAPAAPAVKAANGRFTSEPIKTSKRFNMAGLRWRRGGNAHISVRTRQADGGWSPWTPLDSASADGPDPRSREPEPQTTTNPVWTGNADEIQYRTDRRVSGLKLHFVNVRGSATAGDRVKTGLRRAVNSGVISLSRLAGGGPAQAADGKPGIVTRAQWGASKCKPRTGPEYGTVKAAFVHHTVNPNDYTRAEAPSIVLGICRFHRDSNGWNDIGYNFLVDRFGTIYEGRAGGMDKAVVGAQAQGYNSESTGIANIGTFTDVPQTGAALQAMARLIRWKLPVSGVPTTGPVTLRSAGGSTNRYAAGRNVHLQRVIGHRDTGATECPGNMLYAQIPQLRRLVAGASPLATNVPSLSAKLSKKSVAPGGKLTISGTLRDPGRRRMTRTKLQIQRKLGRRWRTIQTIRTSSRGTYKFPLAGRVNRRVRAHFNGTSALRAKASKALLLGVRASVKLNRVVASASSGRRVRLSGRVKPRKKRVDQVLQLEQDGSWTTVGVLPLKTTPGGRFRGSFVPEGKGSYRVYVRTKRDSRNVASKSRRFALKVRKGAKPKSRD